MPRTLKTDPKLTALARVNIMSLLRFLLSRQELSYRDLAKKLNKMGFEENERNLRNKITKGEMPAAFFLILLKVLEAKSFPIAEMLVLQEDLDRDVEEQVKISMAQEAAQKTQKEASTKD
ncbi:MAG TPA: DUF6471 domain-containing protein [Rhizomicrobium sp.]|nr:DUF6471 domain-containing protein [Rhizomicrobium sp.]